MLLLLFGSKELLEKIEKYFNNHEYILVYSLNKSEFSKSINKLEGNTEMLDRYKNIDNDEKGAWQSVSLNVQAGHSVKSQFYEITSPNGKIHNPPNGRCWVYNKEKMTELSNRGRIWFGKDGNGVPRLKKYLSESEIKLTPETLWLGKDVGTNKEAKKHLLKLFPNKVVFDTPKPERLIKRIFEISTDYDDLILDAYVGSGASISIAHKMKRQYIGIEKGEHIVEYVVERQRLVLEGRSMGILERKSDDNEGFEFLRLNAYPLAPIL
jgi:adenine-specific DNA-methyltransferase